MATRFSNTLLPNSNTAAALQAWASFVEAVIVTTGGWVVTGDTGQTPPGSLTLPSGANQKIGYRIYRMADTLQATAPIFLRVDYGTGGSGCVGMWLTIGTGSDGAGNITGVLSGPTQVWNKQGLATSGAFNCYGSADVNRFHLAMFINAIPNNTVPSVVSLERSKDINGNDTSDGLILIWDDSAVTATLSNSAYIINTVGPQPPAESGVSFVLTLQNPTQSFSPGNIGVGVIIPFKGVAQQPGMGVVMVNSNDVAAEGNFTMTIYGNVHTFQQVRMVTWRSPKTGTSDANARTCIRYD